MNEHKRFREKVHKTSDCWNWVGSRTTSGYGSFWNGERLVPAHRWLYEQYHGPIADGLVLMHSCDNPACVRPSHLKPGTQRDNLLDASAKGRTLAQRSPEKLRRGVDHWAAKLTPDRVVELRRRHAAGEECKRLAREYGLSETATRLAIQRKTWRHVEDQAAFARLTEGERAS